MTKKENSAAFGERAITLISPFPPPLSGQTAYSLYLVETLKVYGLDVLPLPSRAESDGWYGIWRKIIVSLVVALRLAIGPRRRAVFIVLDGGVGLFFNLLFVMVLRIRRARKMLLSHHSFAYIDSQSSLMSLVVFAAGTRATHLFLCEAMKQRFCGRYGKTFSVRLVSNIRRSGRPMVQPTWSSTRDFTVGYFSNITFEKGIVEYFDLVEALIADGENIQGKIAGPANSEAVVAFIHARLARCGGRVRWIGPVYGREKDEFLSGLSVLVFPTNYVNEAQPNVLFEALSHGVPAITIARGCIDGDMASSGSLIARSAKTFIAEALPYTKALIERHQSGDWASTEAAATARFARLYAQSLQDESELIKFMLDT